MSTTTPKHFAHAESLVGSAEMHLNAAEPLPPAEVLGQLPAHEVLVLLEKDDQHRRWQHVVEIEQTGAAIATRLCNDSAHRTGIDFHGHQDVAETLGRLFARLERVDPSRVDTGARDLMEQLVRIGDEQRARLAGEGFTSLEQVRSEIASRLEPARAELEARRARSAELAQTTRLDVESLARLQPELTWSQLQQMRREHADLLTKEYWSSTWGVPSRSISRQSDEVDFTERELKRHEMVAALIDPRAGKDALRLAGVYVREAGQSHQRATWAVHLVNAMIHAANGFTD